MASAGASNTISLSKHRAKSHAFQRLYAEGMELVEETASYLDGEGRTQAKDLSRVTATLYAAESMRLTTRLMQVASWLLLQRALNNGEMTLEQVCAEKSKVRFDEGQPRSEMENWFELPLTFKDLVRRSLRLQDQIRQMDSEVFGTRLPENETNLPLNDNPVVNQINLLHTAFGR